jgi:hypothetical protein
MIYEPGKSFAWFMSYGRGYLGVFAYPGNKRTRYLTTKEGKPVQFETSLEAVAAAQLQVRRQCERDIVASVAADDHDEDADLAKAITAAVGTFKADRERQRIEERQVFKGLGKGFVTVETKRKRA